MERYSFIRKGLAVCIVILFIGTGIHVSVAQKIETLSLPTPSDTTLYVGGSGLGLSFSLQGLCLLSEIIFRIINMGLFSRLHVFPVSRRITL